MSESIGFVTILVGIPGQKCKTTVSISVDIPMVEEEMRKRAKEFRLATVKEFRRSYLQFGIPMHVSGFTAKDFFWAVFTDPKDVETLVLCSDNFYDSWFWKYPPESAMTENPFEDWWYQQGYSDAKNGTGENQPKNEKNILAYKRGGQDYLKSQQTVLGELAS